MKQRCILLTFLAAYQFVSADEPIRERIEWIDIWVTDADKDDLPRVLFVGDSITRGYSHYVNQQFTQSSCLVRERIHATQGQIHSTIYWCERL
jgi:hypothetical protein